MNTKKVSINGKQWRFNIRNDADESVAAEVYKYREYRAADEVIKNAKDPIVDIGAHAGFFTLYARALNPSVDIYAIEPETHNVALLNQHLKDNSAEGNVTVVASALAGSSGTRQLILAPDSHNHRLAPKSEIKPADSLSEKERHLRVPSMTLSEFCEQYRLKSIALLKIDIEGGEYEVLESFRPSDFARVRALIMEYHDVDGHRHQELDELLRVNGFSIQLFPSQFDKTMGFLFAQNKKTRQSQ